MEAYVSNGSVKTNQLFQVQGDQGYLGDFAWSPNGSLLAFTNYRGDHSFVGIYSRNSTKLQWVYPSFDIDGQPTWSPDGTQLAFYRFYEVDDDHGTFVMLQVERFMVVVSWIWWWPSFICG